MAIRSISFRDLRDAKYKSRRNHVKNLVACVYAVVLIVVNRNPDFLQTLAPGPYRKPSKSFECIKIDEIVLQKNPYDFFQIVITKSCQFPQQPCELKKFFTFFRTDRNMLM
jgi:hypothetical protein